jgi:hypothetical protein
VEKKTAYILDNKNKVSVPICALGGSIATAKKWFDSRSG